MKWREDGLECAGETVHCKGMVGDESGASVNLVDGASALVLVQWCCGVRDEAEQDAPQPAAVEVAGGEAMEI